MLSQTWHIEGLFVTRTVRASRPIPATEAVARAVAAELEPVYCKCHDEIAARHTAPVGEMGFYYPGTRPAPSALKPVAMREVYLDAGYCLVPA